MITITLYLKEPYFWGKNNEYSSNQGDFHTTNVVVAGVQFVKFEQFQAQSFAGDLATDFYKYFENKWFKQIPNKYPNALFAPDMSFEEVTM